MENFETVTGYFSMLRRFLGSCRCFFTFDHRIMLSEKRWNQSRRKRFNPIMPGRILPWRRAFAGGLVFLSFFTLSVTGCFSVGSGREKFVAMTMADTGIYQVIDTMRLDLKNQEKFGDSANQETEPRKSDRNVAGEQENKELKTLCFLGVRNETGFSSILSKAVKHHLEESGDWNLVDEKTIKQMVKKSGVTKNDLFIPQRQKAFIKAFDEPPDYLLFGDISPISQSNMRSSFTVQDSDSDTSGKTPSHVLSLVLIEISTGNVSNYSCPMENNYNR